MRKPENGVWLGTKYLVIPFVSKYDDIFDQEEVLINLSTITFHFL